MAGFSFALRGVLVVSAAVGVVAFTYPGGLASAVQDIRDFRENADRVDRCHEQRERFAARSANLSERIHAKHRIAQDVSAGRVDLAAACEQFRALHGDDTAALMDTGPGATLDEKVARNVIGYTLNVTPDGEKARLAAKLEGQLRARFGYPR